MQKIEFLKGLREDLNLLDAIQPKDTVSLQQKNIIQRNVVPSANNSSQRSKGASSPDEAQKRDVTDLREEHEADTPSS